VGADRVCSDPGVDLGRAPIDEADPQALDEQPVQLEPEVAVTPTLTRRASGQAETSSVGMFGRYSIPYAGSIAASQAGRVQADPEVGARAGEAERAEAVPFRISARVLRSFMCFR
jgi:hypothetical protein